MKINFICLNTGKALFSYEHPASVLVVPRKGEPVYLGEQGKRLVHYVRWFYTTDSNSHLDSIDIILS